jgi:hypothetical protein
MTYGVAETTWFGTSSVTAYQVKTSAPTTRVSTAATYFFLTASQIAPRTSRMAASSSRACTFSAPPRRLRLSV